VNYPNVDGSNLVIPPGETREGSWVIVYNELEHPELHDVAPENELYFTDSPFEFQWASVTFTDPDAPRMTIDEWVALYEQDD
jgi:Rps23 Pro-64 3,4-dihydroxylase Tpa1-like proline 4-hydroxylase